MCQTKKIAELLSTNSLNKKLANDILGQILANICFSVLHEISEYIYKEKTHKQAEYNSYCGSIFTNIDVSIKNAHKSKTYDEYKDRVFGPIYEVQVMVGRLADKYEFIHPNEDEPELLIELKKVNKQIYEKFFKKAPRKRKVKANGCKTR